MNTTFIHPEYMANNDEDEKQKFVEYADKLWTFANNVGQFECDDIKAVQTKLGNYKEQNKILDHNITETQNSVRELAEKNSQLQEKIDQLKKENPTITNGLETQYVVIIAFVCFGIGFLAYRIVHTNCIGTYNRGSM